ncbi:ribose 5-phosphate isomerase B [Salipaludibacillus neizhouensis]|uniref:Ribose 5-phosphate isomerase B n=1 Tax=Salipaludibacillus neizhouensis TaxID=885475 RepID=A0A3A9KFR4_9BACI|nr:ribose 5-phosphate isomerase B [Salipaludibacillus neizhouensis]RKL66465.1 ribose 5-phosphate isomerase B [Salipaludibacillus neizhouensis]
MKVGIGCDNNAFDLKEVVKNYIEECGHEVEDYGCYSQDAIDYPDVALKVSKGVSNGVVERGILLCGTGIGMCIAANKFPGIRAALAHDVYSAERAQLSNDAQILTIGSQIIGSEVAKKVVSSYLNSNWSGGSQRKVDKIVEIENEYFTEVSKELSSKSCS